MSIRKATHAGSWYSSSETELNNQLSGWLKDVQLLGQNARAIIAPHAGYSYCGACAGHAYKQLQPQSIKRIFILGPSHHVYLPGCALSSVEQYETPFYPLQIDQKIYEELRATKQFTSMRPDTDENEHSIEMHLPYIAKVMERCKDNFTIVPVLVGGLSRDDEISYGKIFSKYLENPENFFVISSDFCHWGRRFKYTHYEEKHGKIYQSIEHLDKAGIKCIEELDSEKFHHYLKTYGNTICGRHPISVLLNSVEALHKKGVKQFSFRFLDYRQSSKCKHQSDSSVSYVAGALVSN